MPHITKINIFVTQLNARHENTLDLRRMRLRWKEYGA